MNSLDTSSSRSVDGDIVSLDLKNQYMNQIARGHKSRGTASSGNITRKFSTQAGTISNQAPLKVSGLRMPSPKIGFFDGVKSSAHIPKGTVQSQSGIHSMLPAKGGAMCNSNGSSNIKPKLRKRPTARTKVVGGWPDDAKIDIDTEWIEKKMVVLEIQVNGISKHKIDENSNIHGQIDEIISEISDCASETSAITSEPVGGRALLLSSILSVMTNDFLFLTTWLSRI
ncbi:unnamed protein product [Fraxinus pennsylvanica]|uniref:Uncharacterized protein n=1 Tax=Fraxinus pennsylvanica TaxID=56036 RepID=A0AAD1Z2N2_9LAMI|nr:unnamed protein product [Fraxinus pennsylvanica]